MKLHTLIQQGDVEEEGIAGKGRRNKRECTLTRKGEDEEEGIADEGRGLKREHTEDVPLVESTCLVFTRMPEELALYCCVCVTYFEVN